MISDTLLEAKTEIDRYLADPVFAPMYEHNDRVRAVREAMVALLAELDGPPVFTATQVATLRARYTTAATALAKAAGDWSPLTTQPA